MNTRPITEAQLAANRANAILSTGPKTEEGKQIASHNALKTGLTGRTVLLPTDDAAQYEAHCNRLTATHKPATDTERAVVDTIAGLEWRLLRIPTIESGIYALGRRRLAAQFAQDPAENQPTLLESEIFLVYQKDLKNLYLQEARIVRRLEKEIATLKILQQQRQSDEKAKLDEAAAYYRHCLEQNIPYHHNLLAEIGFECSLLDVQRAVATRQSRQTKSPWQTILAGQLLKTLQTNQSA